MRRLKIECTRSGDTGGIARFASAISCDGGEVTIQGCEITDRYSGSAPSSGAVYMRTIAVYNRGIITITPYSHQTTIAFSVGDATGLNALFAERNGCIVFGSTNNSDYETVIGVSGTCTTLCIATSQSLVSLVGGGAYLPSFGIPSGKTLTGNSPYGVRGGSGISAPSGGFPGTYSGVGTVEASTYSWYKTN